MLVLTILHPTSRANLVPKIDNFASKSGVLLVETTMWWPEGDQIWCQRPFQFILIELREIMKHSSSYEYLSLPHNVTFPKLIWCTRLILYLEIWDPVSCSKDSMLTLRGSDTLSEALPIILIHLRQVMKYSSSNGCMSLRHSTILLKLIWSSNLIIFLEMWAHIWHNKNPVMIIRDWICYQRHLYPICYI